MQSTANDEAVDQLERAAAIVEAHNARAGKLAELNAYGVIELRWTDDAGDHYAQGDAELWIQQPQRTALRIDKEGEVLIWLGSNDESWWLFDGTASPTVLHTGSIDAPVDASQAGVVSLHPLTLLDLLGLTPVEAVDGELLQHTASGVRTVRVLGRRGPLVLRFDARRDVLVGVEAIDDDRVIAASVLRDPASARIEGTNLLNWPKMPTLIDITLSTVDGSVRVALDSNMAGELDPDLAARIFDLSRITRAMQPDEVRRVSDAVDADGSGDAD